MQALRPSKRPMVQLYLWLVGVGLLSQGVLSLLLLAFSDRPSRLTHGLLSADPEHAAIHVVWGLLITVSLLRRAAPRTLALLASGFGLFYLSLAMLGMLTHDPFGLQLGAGENGFHVMVGTPGLLFGVRAWRLLRRPRRALPPSSQASTP